MRLAGIILAAGASRRMGTPKALLRYQGETFLERMFRLMRTVCDPVVVVLAPGTEGWAPAGSLTVVNPDPDRGMLSSLQCGLARIDEGSAALFTPMDYPTVHEETIRAVAECDANEIVVPRCEGRRGHPVRISASVARELLALPVLTATPADVIRRDPSRIHYVEVPDPGIHRDIDLPADYQELLQQC